ncbi:MAG: DUF1801 domain-containing protein [Arenicellales bacterium]
MITSEYPFSDPAVEHAFLAFPRKPREKLLNIRALIFEVHSALRSKSIIEETLKWGEPAYLRPFGSTVRLAWKSKTPDQYGLYFHCQSKLIDTFKEIYAGEFRFEGNRAIIFNLDDQVPSEALKHCLSMALNYHHIKHLPLLDA